MKTTLIALISVLLLFCSGVQVMAGAEDELRLKVIHYSSDDFRKYSPECKHQLSAQAESGKSVLDVFPLSEILAIEIDGDEIVLPTSIALTLVTLGRFAKPKDLISTQTAPSVRIRLKNGNCTRFELLLNPADMSVAYAKSAIGMVRLPDESQCKSFKPSARVGMTRAELERFFCPDGGITAPFRYERYVSSFLPANGQGQKVKVNFAFKPSGMSDEVYYLGKWQTPKSSDSETVMRYSPPYRERPIND